MKTKIMVPAVKLLGTLLLATTNFPAWADQTLRFRAPLKYVVLSKCGLDNL